MSKSPIPQNGFTTIELLITIIVAAMFTITFYQMFMVLNSFSTATKQQALADNLAYTYVKKYIAPDVITSSWFTCSTASGSSNINDRTVNPNAPGSTIESGSLTPSSAGLQSPVTYTVTAVSLYGCTGNNAGTPIEVQAVITYGPQHTTIRHMGFTQ